MQEKSLYNLSLICFLIGLFLILLITEKINLDNSDIASIKQLEEKQTVKVKGFVSSLSEFDNFLIFDLKDNTGNITIIAFNLKKKQFKEGDLLEVEGEITFYNEKTEIEATKISLF